jgi:hypothetical protein
MTTVLCIMGHTISLLAANTVGQATRLCVRMTVNDPSYSFERCDLPCVLGVPHGMPKQTMPFHKSNQYCQPHHHSGTHHPHDQWTNSHNHFKNDDHLSLPFGYQIYFAAATTTTPRKNNVPIAQTVRSCKRVALSRLEQGAHKSWHRKKRIDIPCC